MSKTETVKALNDSGPQLAILENIQTLQQSIDLLQEDLQALPAAIARETAATLEPLTELTPQIAEAIQRYDEVAATQRQSLDAMARAMGDKAATAFERRAARIDTALKGVADSLKSLKETAKAATGLPAKITTATGKLTAAAKQVRPPRWIQVLALMLAGLIGAALVQTGLYVGFDRQARLDAERKPRGMEREIWERAERRGARVHAAGDRQAARALDPSDFLRRSTGTPSSEQGKHHVRAACTAMRSIG